MTITSYHISCSVLLHRLLDSYYLDRFLPVFSTVDTGKGWHSQGDITTWHKMRHSMSLPTVTHICMRELPHFHHGPTSSFLHSQPFKLIHVDQGSCGPLAKCSFGIIPLSRYSVDRSPRAFHSSRSDNTYWLTFALYLL